MNLVMIFYTLYSCPLFPLENNLTFEHLDTSVKNLSSLVIIVHLPIFSTGFPSVLYPLIHQII